MLKTYVSVGGDGTHSPGLVVITLGYGGMPPRSIKDQWMVTKKHQVKLKLAINLLCYNFTFASAIHLITEK